MIKRKLTCGLAYFAMSGLGMGCASNPSTKVLYTLQSPPMVAPAIKPVALDGALGIGPIELPESFSGDRIAVIGSDQQVRSSQNHRWAGDLKKNISRTLASDLSKILDYQDVWPYPWDARHRPDKQVSVYVESLSGELGQPVTMVAKWIFFDDSGNRVLSIGREQLTADTVDKSYDSYVAAINDLVNELSRRLADAISAQWGPR